MIKYVQRLNEQAVLIVLVGVAVLSLMFSAFSHWMNGSSEWWAWADSAAQNFSTEMIGAVVTFGLFELVLGTQRKAKDKSEAERGEKQRLLVELRSSDNGIALNALEQIRAKGWHKDGTLYNVNLTDANLRNADFSYADLQGIDFFHANLQQSRLDGANLKDVHLNGADLSYAMLNSVDLKGAYLKSTSLRGADLSKTNLQGAVLYDSSLRGAKMHFTNLQGADITETDLRDADFYSADLRGANLSGASLAGARLTDTKFDELTVLPDARSDEDEEGNDIYSQYWTPQTDMSRYTDGTHPNYRRSDLIEE